MDGLMILVFVVFAAAMIIGVIQANAWMKKRREELFGLATRLGLRFSMEKDYNLPARLAFLDQLGKGSNRYACNVLSGVYEGHDIIAFDYHYETHSTDSKGRRQTHHHYFSFFVLVLPVEFPELNISREGVFSKIAQALGYDDIDFESAEFSRRFCVRSGNKRFAYDVCHPQMMEYLLANDDLSIEIESRALALAFNGRIAASEFERNLRRLLEIRARLPNYLFTPA